MQRGLASRLRGLSLVLALAVVLANAGCVPGTAWLPDSSGIIYTGGKDYNQLLHYDLKKKEAKVLVKDTGASTLWPAVSPDGKRIAVARLVFDKDGKSATVQVVVYGRDGKELQRSKVFPFLKTEKPAGKGDRPAHPQLFWAPRGDRVLVHAHMYTAICDLKKDRLINLNEAVLLNFSGGPVRPDGAGFLVMQNVSGWLNLGDKKAQDRVPRFALVDWDGKERAIKPPPLLLDEKALAKEKDQNKLTGLLCPILYQSGWDGDVAWVSWNVDRLRYFTKKGEAVIDRVNPELAGDRRIVQVQHKFPGGAAELRLVSLPGVEKKAGDQEGVRIEVVKGERTEVLLEQADACIPAVAPNRKMVALRCIRDSRKKDMEREEILIVGEKGDVIARLNVPR